MAAQSARIHPWRLYLGVLAPTLVMACLVAALAAISVQVLGAVRGYATGENAWSKSCADAVLFLRDFAASHDMADFARYEQAMVVPISGHLAWVELNKPHPDTARVQSLFTAVGSHPKDVDNMVILFQCCSKLPWFKRPLASWPEGDALAERVQNIGKLLHQQVQAQADQSAIQDTLQQLRHLSNDYTEAEKGFRTRLDDAGRMTELMLIGLILLAAAVLTLASLALVRRSLYRQVRHERALAAATKKWEMAAEVAGLGLFEQNSKTDDVILDAKAAYLYGMGKESCRAPRQQLDNLICDDDRIRTMAAINRAMQTGQPLRHVHRIVRADGSLRQVELIGRPDTHRPRSGSRLVGLVRDVTDEQAQAQLTIQRDAAEQVAHAQREFLSRLSHELRTPLNAILGFAQLLELDRTTPLPTHQHQQVAMILTAGQQLLALIEDVLDLTKVESGEINMALQPVEMTGAMRASMAMVDSVRQALNVTLVDRLPQDRIWVQADPQRLQQVFMNLLSNACKYNRPGGQVTVSSHAQDHTVTIEIQDEGLGMSAEETAQLFKPFRRIATTAGLMEGTGLGLYIVKQLIERMQGQVQVRSEKGKGSTFAVTLPTPRPITSPSHAAV